MKNMKNKKEVKLKIILVFLLMTVFLNIFINIYLIAQSQNQVPKDYNERYRYYLEHIDKFADLSNDERNELFKNIGPDNRNALVSKLTRDILINRDIDDRSKIGFKSLIKRFSNDLISQFLKEGVNLYGIESSQDFEKLAEQLGIDTNPYLDKDPLNLQIRGFQDSSLKWSEKGNIIGNPELNVWLNLDDLPRGLYRIEYKNNRFELTFKGRKIAEGKHGLPAEYEDGVKLIIEGGIDEKGELKISPKDKDKPLLSLQDLIISGAKDGKVILTKDNKIKFEGNAKLSLKGYSFERPVTYKGLSEIEITNNGFIIQGVDIEIPDFLKRTASDIKLPVVIGNFKETIKSDLAFETTRNILLNRDVVDEIRKELGIPKKGDIQGSVTKEQLDQAIEKVRNKVRDENKQRVDRVKDQLDKIIGDSTTSLSQVKKHLESIGSDLFAEGIKGLFSYSSTEDPLDSVVREASFEDVSGIFGTVSFRFNNRGEAFQIKVAGNWVNLKLDYESDPDLGVIHSDSGGLVKSIIESVSAGNKVTFQDIKKGFYSDDILKSGGREITIDSYQDNFMAINGDNLILGGLVSSLREGKTEGKITLLTDLNSIKGIDAFASVNIGKTEDGGDAFISIRNDDLSLTRRPVKENYNIGDITLISSKEGTKSIESWQLLKDEKTGKLIKKESDRIVAGREVVKLPFGGSVDLSLQFPREDIPRLEKLIGNREKLIQEMLKTGFSAKVDINVPLGKGVLEMSSADAQKLIEDHLTSLISRAFPSPISKQEVALNQDAINAIKEIAKSAVQQTGDIKPGKISISFQNNPKTTEIIEGLAGTETIVRGGDPTLEITFPGEELREIKLTGDKAVLVKDLLEGSLRAPDVRKKGFTRNFYLFFPRKTEYWPPPHLKDVYDRLGGKLTYLNRPDEERFKKFEGRWLKNK